MPSIASWHSRAPLVIAHRGASAYAPENTMASFHRAVEMGADAVEMDAKLTRDSRVVILHDATVNRTTNGSGSVSRLWYEEIRRLDAGIGYSLDYVGERVPTLEDVIQGFGGVVLLNIELTNYTSPWDDLPSRVIRLVTGSGLDSEVMLTSFNPLALRRCHQLNREIRTGLLIHPGSPKLFSKIFRRMCNYEFLLPHESLIRSDDRRWDRKIIAWTVNSEERIRELLTNGIAGIITDVPDVACKLRHQIGKWTNL